MDHITSARRRPDPARRPSGSGGPIGRRAWLPAGIAVAAVGWGANQFSPLLLVYRSLLGLSTATVDLTFGLYALGLIPSLLVGGPLSDRFGRRRVVVPALLISFAASVVLVLGGSATSLLFAGRLAAGVASGAAFAAGVAWIKELSAATGRPADQSSGPRRSTIAMTAGFALGPLVAGMVAQFAPEPTIVPYLPHLALVVVALVLLVVLRTPETREPGRSGEGRVRTSDLRDPRFLGVVLPLAPWVFGSAAVALAYLPGLVEARLGAAVLAFAAVVTMLTGLAGILVQPLARRVDRPGTANLLAASLTVVVVGMVASAVATVTRSPAVVVLATLVLGAGYGACQVCGLAEVQRLARPGSLAGLTAVYQAVSYVGFGLPYLFAAASDVLEYRDLLLVTAGLAAATLGWTVHRARRTRPDGRPPAS